MHRRLVVLLTAVVLGILALFIACGSGGGSSSFRTVSTATVTTTLSDPATCSSSASGPYSNVWVTITDVLINASASAADNDPNWIDLTPTLKNAPQQVDLLAAANNQCFLATLGSSIALQPGTYQQIRIILADNTTANVNLLGASNKCGSGGVNCVILALPNPNTPQILQLSSESKTGLKIPSGQIAGGAFTLADGQTKDLNIDFDTCASLVVQGNGQFRLKPVLHAGEVALTSPSINGKLVDRITNLPIVGGKAIVALEQKDSNGVDRVIMQVTPDNTGAFNFCPVPGGAYDVVAVAVSGANLSYAATITAGVQPGNALGNIPMDAVTGANTAPGSITGQVTTVNATSNGATVDVLLSALQTVSSTIFTIPAGTQAATLSVATDKPSTCAADPCPPYTFTYTMTPVPPVSPTVGAFSATSPTIYTAGSGTPPATYVVEAQTFVPMSGGTGDCNPSKQTTAAVSVNPGTPAATATTLAFTGCQ
ncbi:MAG: DUF4382 domain-containing protein [Acidobacteriia bacterium]|nr:DUF4382 domain-containing protein [Terriglobia bacterium]